ncbi:MAG: T9SS type A sorting domain-containing protein, partial [Bacteroidales bacterium]|nr:T9SS type A sorting domain-containing protein [Bacteroidales bacterium]
DSVSLFIGGNTVYDMAFDDMILHSNASNGFFSLLGPDIHIGIVSPPEAAAGFPVYPNPASGTVNINSAGFGNQHLVLEIINPLGQVTYKNEWGINPGIISVDLWNQSPGVYFVRLQSENRVGNGRFIKQ